MVSILSNGLSRFRLKRIVGFSFFLLVSSGISGICQANEDENQSTYFFTPQDIQYLSQFSIANLPPPPPSLSNKYANKLEAAKFGQRIFFDTRFSKNKNIACATCHQPENYFTDGLTVAKGNAALTRNTPSILGTSYGPWLYWDGRKDSLWAQALEPLEHPDEQGLDRKLIAKTVVQYYYDEYKNIFSTPPENNTKNQIEEVITNVAKSIMAYERKLTLPPSPFDQFIKALERNSTEKELADILNVDQVKGLRLFAGKAVCASCHNGPLFTNFEFHNVGIPEADQQNVDLGRYTGIEKLANDEFSCLGNWSDANKEECEEMQYLKKQGPELVGAFKTPSLRNVAKTSPYMHAGQFKTLEEVVGHYSKPKPPFYDPQQHPNRPHFDILPLNLTEEEQNQLVGFLHSLTSPLPHDDLWWKSPN